MLCDKRAGDITQKGYDKKRLKLLTPYLASQKATGKFLLFPYTNAVENPWWKHNDENLESIATVIWIIWHNSIIYFCF